MEKTLENKAVLDTKSAFNFHIDALKKHVNDRTLKTMKPLVADLLEYIEDLENRLIEVKKDQEISTKKISDYEKKNEETRTLLNDLRLQNEKMEKAVCELRCKINDLSSSNLNVSSILSSNVSPSNDSVSLNSESYSEGCRERSVVLSGLANFEHLKHYYFENTFDWITAIRREIEEMFRYLNIPFIPVDIFVMGKYLVKVRMGSREAQKQILLNAHKLRHSESWYGCHFRPSLTQAQRDERTANYKRVKAEYDEKKRGGAKVFLRSLPDHIGFELVETDNCLSAQRIQPAIPPHRRQYNQKY